MNVKFYIIVNFDKNIKMVATEKHYEIYSDAPYMYKWSLALEPEQWHEMPNWDFELDSDWESEWECEGGDDAVYWRFQ